MEDPRRILEAAAESRLAVEVLPRGAAVMRGTFVRVERGGVVLAVAGSPPAAGTDLRCWLSVEGESWTFEASVLRSGVPVPDRGQGGVLLGFIDGWRKTEAGGGHLVLEALPPNGGPVSLTEGEVRLVDLHPEEWLVTVPSGFPLVFVEGGAVRLRLGAPGRAPMEVGAEVRELTRSHGHLLYRLGIVAVEDQQRYAEIVAALRSALAL
jgi:hypothetical protein